MEIHPGKGVGRLHFGLTEPELLRELGNPDKRYLTTSSVHRLQYFALRMEFAIEPDNGHLLGWIEVHCPEATLFGQRIVGEPAVPALSLITTGLVEEHESEDYGSFESYFYRRSWVEIQVRFGRVESINLGVPYDEADEPLWPGAV